MKVLSVIGTRAEAVKMAPVVKALSRSSYFESKLCVTAQHREMLDQVLNIFNIKPDIDLDLMRPNQSLAQITARVFIHLDPVLEQIKPDWLLTQGDTTTVMASALLGFYHRVKVGHVEAGLRTGDKWQPFPEEVHRKIAGVVADLNFAPTQRSRQNLLKEGVPDHNIAVTGNTVVDALYSVKDKPDCEQVKLLLDELKISNDNKKLILVTAHRRENHGKPLENICLALKEIAEHYAGQVEIVYPVHLNPNVQNTVKTLLKNVKHITLLDPLDYLPLVQLQNHAKLILTDSGGIQEEATALGKPVLVLREKTERPEGVEAGVLKLIGTDKNRIVQETRQLLEDVKTYQKMTSISNPFGDGKAAEKILQAIRDFEGQENQ
ncbi:MAG: UDP-N-acetylglucosamine 2-epimerase (non-hydrolyzing) [Anaerolineaceae bacterium]|nr:UDP-N-acetylglucosamine 2-epimerase (non-hydrolyzing) [Anaerolineaceae bacterium]